MVEGKEAATEKMTMVKDTVVEKVFILLYIGCDWRKPGSNKGEDKHLVWLCHLWRGRVRRVPGCRHQPEESCHPFERELKSSAGADGDRLLLHVGHRHLPPA